MNDIACTLNVAESTGYLLCVCVGEQNYIFGTWWIALNKSTTRSDPTFHTLLSSFPP